MKQILAAILISLACIAHAIEKPEGAVYCYGKTTIEYRLINPERNGTASDVELIINGKTTRYITAYSWFGANQATPKNFRFAILGEREFDPLLVFDGYLVDAKNNKYMQCN